MRKTKVVPLRLPENLDDLAALSAREQQTDKATTLRQWIHQGAARYLLGLVAEGRLSGTRAAELLDLTIYDIHRLADLYRIELGASDEQRRESWAVAAKLVEEFRKEAKGKD